MPLNRDAAHSLRHLLLTFLQHIDTAFFGADARADGGGSGNGAAEAHVAGFSEYVQVLKVLDSHVSLPVMREMRDKGELKAVDAKVLGRLASSLFRDESELKHFLAELA